MNRKIENAVKLKEAEEKLSPPQCPECGYHNVHIIKKKRVDFYGRPVVFHCDCGWEKEIVLEDLTDYGGQDK